MYKVILYDLDEQPSETIEFITQQATRNYARNRLEADSTLNHAKLFHNGMFIDTITRGTHKNWWE